VWSTIRSAVWNFCRGVKNLIEWRRVIWNDRSWDHTYLLRILRHKIHLMSNEWASPKNDFLLYEGAEDDLRAMREVERTLTRLIEDDYAKKERAEDAQRFGEYVDFGKRERGSKEEWLESIRSISAIEEQERNADMDRLFELLRQNIRRWWY
jgi:hypothetical protein